MPLAVPVDVVELGRICRAHGVVRLRAFGSAVNGTFDEERSDIDLLVEFESGRDDAFRAYFGLTEDLEALFGRAVDLVMPRALQNPYFAQSVLREAEDLFVSTRSSP